LSEWAGDARDPEQFFALLRMASCCPTRWLEWVENRYSAIIRDGRAVRDPLRYRLAVLQTGVVHLQEAKFICDLLENALRTRLEEWPSRNALGASAMAFALYRPTDAAQDGTVPSLYNLSFYELTETYRLNWKAFPFQHAVAPGLRKLFWSQPSCRDVNAFLHDMKWVRLVRNEIAHTRKLFSADDLRWLFGIANKWMLALGADSASRITEYRTRRPRFLEVLLQSGKPTPVCATSTETRWSASVVRPEASTASPPLVIIRRRRSEVPSGLIASKDPLA
jgi:hypothetical protein